MVISADSQLGLRFEKGEVFIKAIEIVRDKLEDKNSIQQKYAELLNKRAEHLRGIIEEVESLPEEEREKVGAGVSQEELKIAIDNELSQFQLPERKEEDMDLWFGIKSYGTIEQMFIDKPDKYFLIQSTVYKAAELIKIGQNFTGRTLKDIKLGSYVYLMGKHEMIKFLVTQKGIKGIYFDDKKEDIFEWGVEMETGRYFCENGYNEKFSTIMQIMTFIELGDISVKWVQPLQKIKAPKKEDNTYNASNHTVYIVDSAWNQIVVRTDGFAVRGHFKLQPCGPGNMDRKLIWINAFEKHGYTRKPKGTIIHNYGRR